jgi:hypothetical protein
VRAFQAAGFASALAATAKQAGREAILDKIAFFHISAQIWAFLTYCFFKKILETYWPPYP